MSVVYDHMSIADFGILRSGFTDGSGTRSILNEYISRLARSLPSDKIHWGKEVDKLLPPFNVLVKPEQRLPVTTQLNTQSNTFGSLFVTVCFSFDYNCIILLTLS